MVCKAFSETCLHWRSCRLTYLAGGLLGLAGGPLDLMLGNRTQIMGNHAPADPALHPLVAVVAAASQSVAPFEPTDPPFDPRAPVAAFRNQRCRSCVLFTILVTWRFTNLVSNVCNVFAP